MGRLPATLSPQEDFFDSGVRVRRIGSVNIMMPGLLPLHLVLSLLSSPDPGPVAPGITELPGGRDSAFRPSAELPAEAERRELPEARVALPRLSSRFGRRGDPFRKAAAMHSGIDIPGQLGTPVLASAPGVVRFAGIAGSYGAMVEIDHDGAFGTRYAHLSRILVRPGARVGQGQPVALMGSTGRSTGSHLHFEVRVAGRAVDPLRYLGVEVPAPPARAWIKSDAPHISAFARARAATGQGRTL